MAFGIIRVRRISEGKINSTEKHNDRLYQNESERPENVKSEGKHTTFYEYLDSSEQKFGTLKEAIMQKIKAQNVKGIRKNSALALEYVVTINDPKVWNNYSPRGFFNDAKKWLEERHGKDCIVSVSEHYDESNPHAHIILVPTKKKVVKWKNAKGSGERIETRLNTREFTQNRNVLRKLQDDYFKFIKRYEKKMGVKFYRGTLAEHQQKAYSMQTNHKLGEIRSKLSDLSNEKEFYKAKLKEIRLKQIQALNQDREKAIHEKKRKSKNNWQNKGSKGINFH